MNRDTPTNVSQGRKFENDVEAVLRLLGASTTRDTLIASAQSDIVATFVNGRIITRVLVECKWSEKRQAIPIEEIKEFAGVVLDSRGRHFDKAIVVTNGIYTKHTKSFALEKGIDLLTYDELANQLIDTESYCARVRDAFAGDGAAKRYVTLSCSVEEDYRAVDLDQLERPLETSIRSRIDKGQTRIALLGNFGTGKSTFCRKWASDLASEYLAAGVGRIPIVVNLGDYDTQFDIHQLVVATLTGHYGVRIDVPLCVELQRRGRLLLFLDGFDEMSSRVDPAIVEDNVRQVQKLASISANAIVLTCRTHFFRDSVQSELLHDFVRLYIPEWGEPELREYLGLVFGKENWKKHFDRIRGTHNLPELAETPLFLEMIVRTLPALGDKVGRAELYRQYTTDWIIAQSAPRRRGARLVESDRRRVISELARRRFRQNENAVHYKDLASLVQAHLNIKNAADIDYIEHDVRTCTFLARDGNGLYSFRHKSFYEYFIAECIADEVREGKRELVAIQLLTPEVRGFVVEMLDNTQTAITCLQEALQRPSSALEKSNALALLAALRADLGSFVANDKTEAMALLFARMSAGDDGALGQILRLYHGRVRTIATRYVHNQSDVDDVVSDVFVRMMSQSAQMPDFQQFDAYIVHTAKAVALSKKYRGARQVRETTLPDNLLDTVATTDVGTSAVMEAETRALVQCALVAMPRDMAEILRLSLLGKSTTTIATALGCSVHAVQHLRRKGMSWLREALLR